ncbi:MAG: hypothetical protein ACXVKP_20105, partial [Ilumatobacteraceae bacterium]
MMDILSGVTPLIVDVRQTRSSPLLTPNRRRQAAAMLQLRFGVSQRRSCRVIGQHRSTQRLALPVPEDEEVELRAWLRAFSRE